MPKVVEKRLGECVGELVSSVVVNHYNIRSSGVATAICTPPSLPRAPVCLESLEA